MDYILVAVLGFIGGAFSGFFLWEPKRIRLKIQERDQEAQSQRLKKASQANDDRTHTLDKKAAELEFTQTRFINMIELQDENVILKRDLRNLAMLHKTRINKTNPRKEFFKADIATIFQIVKEHHGEVEYVVDAEALQYRQSISMSDDDQEFIESVYDDLDEEKEVAVDEV